MADNDIEIRIRVSGDGAAAFRRVRSESRALEGDLGRVTDTLGIMPMSLGKFAAVGVPAIGLVGQAAAAAGPLILSLAAAGASVALGMDGIKAAAKTIEPAFESMKKSVSGIFEKQLTPVMKNLADNVFPTLTVGMKQMASSLSSAGREMVNFLASEEGAAKLKATLAGAATFIDGMRPGLVALTDALLTMGAAAAPAMNELGAAFGSIFESLNTEIQGLVSSGVFQQAIEGFSSTVRGLGTLIAQVFGAIVTMGAGLGDSLGNSFRLIGDIIGAITPILGVISQAVGVALNAIVTAATPVVQALTPIIELMAGALSDAIVTLTPAIQAIAQAFGGALATAITALRPAFDAMVPVIGTLAQIMSTVLTTALQALQPLFAAIGPIAKIFADALIQLMPAVQAIALALGGAIVQAIQSMAPVFQQLADAAVQLAPVIADLAVQFGQALAQAIVQIAPLIPVIVQAFMDILAALIPLIPKFIQLAQEILPLLPPVFQAIIDVVTVVVPILAKIIVVLADIIVGIIDFVVNAKQKWEEFKTATAEKWEQIKEYVKGKFLEMVNYVVGEAEKFVNLLKGKWEQFKADTKAKFDETVESIKTAFDIDWAAVGQGIIDGIKNGITNAIPNLVSAAANAALSAFNAAKAQLGIASPSKLFRDGVGQQITAGMALGITRTAGVVALAAQNAAAGALQAATGAAKHSPAEDAFLKDLAAARKAGKAIFEDYTWKGMSNAYSDDNLRLNAVRGGGRASPGSAAPAAGGMGAGGHSHAVTFAGNLDSGLATLIMKLIRTGQIQIA